jgi:plasmid maintenance system killer protein
MQHKIVRPLVLSAFISMAVTSLMAETSENFNSRRGVPVQNIKSTLQNSCWSFHHFDVNTNGWNPGIEGDGAMVATSDAAQFDNSGIYTPVLDVPYDLNISFEYTFNEDFKSDAGRWMKLCLATANNDIVQVLETIRFDGVNAKLKKKYSTGFKNLFPGQYRLVLQYGGNGTASQIAVDELKISAPYLYAGGCNTSPVAARDRITGMSNRSASGSLLQNDKDVNHETLTAYLIKGSPDGKIELSENGSFIFTPNKGFSGNATHFTYKICDNGTVNLCSANTTVLITFPEAPRSALNLVDFRGSYRHNGNVELVWKTGGVTDAQKFEVERSIDGQTWENTGTISAENAANANGYTFTDRLSRNKVQKNDLYYRLKQVNTDGSSVSSRLLVVRVYNTKTLTMISVTPNPAKNDIGVNVQLQEDAFVSLRVLDNAGSSVMHKIVDASKGLSNLTLEGTSRLTPGAYSLEVIVNSKERMVVKLIKE